MNTLLFWMWIAGALPVVLSMVWGVPYIHKYKDLSQSVNVLAYITLLVFVFAIPVGWFSVEAAFPEYFGDVPDYQVDRLVAINGFYIIYALAWWLAWWLIRRPNRRLRKAALNDKKLFDKTERQRVKDALSSD